MTDLEIDKALALAIGWSKYDVRNNVFTGNVLVFRQGAGGISKWVPFSHKDWNVIGPIAELHNMFPYAHRGKDGRFDGRWVVWPDTLEDTPRRAIALAVIKGAKK